MSRASTHKQLFFAEATRAFAGTTRAAWSCALLLCLVPRAQAQSDAELPNLLFEPVVIEVIETGEEPGVDAPYTVRELTALPRGQTTELKTWLSGRSTVLMAAPEQLAADIAAYEQRILELEAAGGAFNTGLDEQLLGLGSALQQSGDLNRAQEVLDRALHVNRVNSGLFGMSQIPIIERTIENHLARGDLVAADEQHEYLLYVQRKNLNNRAVDLLPALTRYAEWNLFAFRARLVPAVATSTGEDVEDPDAARDNSDMMLDFRTGRLITAHHVYQSIIEIVTNNFGNGDSRLLNFERQLALTNYLYIATFGLEGGMDPAALFPDMTYLASYDSMDGRPPLGFRQGRDSLERRVAYLESQTDTAPLAKAQAKLDLADWMLMFSKRMGSLDIYQEAWQDMKAAGATEAELTAVFNPPYPKEVPAYLDHPYSREALDIPDDLALDYHGYIDVEFELSRFGVPSSIGILNKSPSATPLLETLLVRHLRRSQFRPRIVDGEVRDNETMQARFYFTY